MSDEQQPQEIQLSTSVTTVTEVAAELAKLDPAQFLQAVRVIVAEGHADEMREVLDAIEIMGTPSAFDGDNVQTLEEAAATYPFKWWLEQQNKDVKDATRQDVVNWWDYFMTMASARGYKPHGRINTTGQTTNLWKATGNLAKKMLVDPPSYMYLPAILINNSEQVGKALDDIVEPTAFLEVLTGEAWEDMQKSPNFLTAFSTIEQEGAEGAIASVMLALQR